MPTYAMVVVVEADAPDEAHLALGEGALYAKFVGDPWPVTPLGTGLDIGTPDHFETACCIAQHPERPRRGPWEC